MAEGDIGSVQGSLEFDTGNCYHPIIIHVHGLIYAIAMTGTDFDGWLRTVSISADGQTLSLTGYSLQFETGAAYETHFIKISANVFAVVYKDAGNNGIVKTMNVSDDGETLSLTGETLEFEAATAKEPWIIHVSGDTYAIVYGASDNDGWITTVSISGAGVIGATIITTLEFEAGAVTACHIIHVSGDVYAIAYRDSANEGKIATISISGAGVISLAGMTTALFDTTAGWDPTIIHIAGLIYTVVYKGAVSDGFMRSVNISNDGSSITPLGTAKEFDTSDIAKPWIMHVSGDVYAVVYTGTQPDGRIRTYHITDAGVITDADVAADDFDVADVSYIHAIYCSGNIYAIVYRNSSGYGDLVTIDIETVPPAAAVKHLMMMGVG